MDQQRRNKNPIPARKRRINVLETNEVELKVNEKRVFNSYIDSDILTREGTIVVRQRKSSNDIRINEGSGREITIKNSENRVDVFGPNIHLRVEETGTGGRRVTLAVGDSQGLYEKTIEIGANNATAKLGNLDLKHGKDGALEISMRTVGEQDKITFSGFGEDRRINYEYTDNYEHRNNYGIYVSSVKDSGKATSNENKERIIAL